MMRDRRIKYYAPADYSEGTEIDYIVKEIIDRTAANEKLESRFFQYAKESKENELKNSADEAKAIELIMKLESSRSFAYTHTIISELLQIPSYSQDQIDLLCKIAISNGQVKYIIKDTDLEHFYSKILKNVKNTTESESAVIDLISKDRDE